MTRKKQRLTKLRAGFFLIKIIKTDKPLARLRIKERRQINKIRNERGNVTTNITKYKESYKTTMNNYMQTNLIT